MSERTFFTAHAHDNKVVRVKNVIWNDAGDRILTTREMTHPGTVSIAVETKLCELHSVSVNETGMTIELWSCGFEPDFWSEERVENCRWLFVNQKHPLTRM